MPDTEPLPLELERFLDAGPPPVSFGLGSVTDPEAVATSAMVLQAVRARGLRLVMSRGWAGYELPEPADDAIAIGAVNHQRLFSRVAVAIHHGGAGTTVAAARAGVPHIVIPHLGDQFEHARRMHALGVAAEPFGRPALSHERLSAALDEVLGTASVQSRATALGANLRQRDGVRTAVELLEAEHLRRKPVR